MRLFLYSGGDAVLNRELDEAFLKAIGNRSRITYIPASSRGTEHEFQRYSDDSRKLGKLRTLCFAVDRPFSERTLNEALSSEAIFLSGGNTYHFLGRLRAARMISRLRRYVEEGGILAGLSAGSIIMTPSIDLAGLVPGESDRNDYRMKRTGALGLTDFEVYPHFVASSASVKLLKKYSAQGKGRTIYAFPDGAGIECAGASVIFHGKVTTFSAGHLNAKGRL